MSEEWRNPAKLNSLFLSRCSLQLDDSAFLDNILPPAANRWSTLREEISKGIYRHAALALHIFLNDSKTATESDQIGDSESTSQYFSAMQLAGVKGQYEDHKRFTASGPESNT